MSLSVGLIPNNPNNNGTANALANCAAVGQQLIVYGANLLTNGDFLSSTGTGVTSLPAVGWTTTYTAAANVLLASASYAFFTTNAGAVTGGNIVATGISSLTGRSMAVNMGIVLADPLMQWANIYLENGKSYTLSASVATITAPYGAGVYVDGVQVIPLPAPTAVGVWQTVDATFVFTGVSGLHNVSINTTLVGAAGNELCFDNLTLRQTFQSVTETRTVKLYDTKVNAIIDQIVETTNCNDDRRDILLSEIAQRTGVNNALIDSTVVRQAGVGVQTIASGARSVTVIVLAGTPTVSISGAAVVTLSAGLTLTWGVDTGGKSGESLRDTFVFTGVAGSNFIVTSTREV